jgi:hypothetical protein
LGDSGLAEFAGEVEDVECCGYGSDDLFGFGAGREIAKVGRCELKPVEEC